MWQHLQGRYFSAMHSSNKEKKEDCWSFLCNRFVFSSTRFLLPPWIEMQSIYFARFFPTFWLQTKTWLDPDVNLGVFSKLSYVSLKPYFVFLALTNALRTSFGLNNEFMLILDEKWKSTLVSCLSHTVHRFLVIFMLLCFFPVFVKRPARSPWCWSCFVWRRPVTRLYPPSTVTWRECVSSCSITVRWKCSVNNSLCHIYVACLRRLTPCFLM